MKEKVKLKHNLQNSENPDKEHFIHPDYFTGGSCLYNTSIEIVSLF